MQNTNLASNDNTGVEEVSVSLRHYEFKKRLGEGGFGQVHEAWDSKLCRPVAIKQLKATEGAGSAIQTSSLLKEARLAASLKHPAFVKIFAIEDEDNSHSIVMELVPGLTLKQLLQQNPQQPLPEQQAINIISQVAEAMQEAHASGLIHGDLKPSNLMVEPDGKVRILDFGLASKTDAQATTSMSQLDPQGTIAYMAPERMMGSPASAQSDIYALGVILYETLTGQRPFANASGLALAAALMQSNSDTWEFPAGCKPELIKLVLAMTARQTEKRLNNMQQVHEQLRGLVSVPVLVAAGGAVDVNSISGNGWKALSKPKRFAIVSAIIVALGYGAWQAVPYLEMDKMSLKPFSESLTMKQGLEALRQYDIPSSLNKAQASFETILKRNPDHAGAVAGLSIIYTFRYDSDRQDSVLLQKADASAQQALKLNDKLALSHIALARVRSQMGKNDLAQNSYEQALALDPDNIFATFGLVTVLRKLKRYDEAIKIAAAGLEKFPYERMFAEELGAVYAELSKYTEAEKFFRISIKIQPDSVAAYANLSNILVRQNRETEAKQILQQGLLIRPDALLYSNMGQILFNDGEYVKAAEAFEAAISPDKGSPARYDGWANWGDTLRWIPGQEEKAKKAYERARELLSQRLPTIPKKADATMISRFGLYSIRIGDMQTGMKYLYQALELDPENRNVHFRLGLAHELLGKRDEAINELGMAIKYQLPIKTIESEPDLLSLRRDQRYIKLVDHEKK
ncbi:hypothetical protein UNDYM_0081 [Undibacterium sp. YM2]|uniref:serine/threonine-protein kinase n=1 Tax=Undibacterium sp. YM2 TaxID=2058625 RepID=UPI001331C989|nr:serine/threonine-protein kinase [Undibacterium sp. YM2]BBB64334.1 hypothetical protein UNDYM_0081 [Undibacterium sp. YM2]